MDLREYARLLQRRWRLVALCTLLGLGAAVFVSLTGTKVYTSSMQLFVSARDGSNGSNTDVNGAYTGSLFIQQRVKSYASVISSDRVADLVRQDLGLNRSASAIAHEVSASAPLDTVLLNVSVKDQDAGRAEAIAASVGRVFPDLVDDLEASADGTSPVKVSVVQPPKRGVQTSPRPVLDLILGSIVGLVLGVVGAILRETFDVSIKDPGQAARLTGAPVIGTISFDGKAGKAPLIVASSAGSPRAEAFRQLRTNLQFVNIDEPLRSLVLTSAVPGEGKSTSTCNLGIALAEAGLRVILVEADLRRPRVAEYLGLEGAVGLTSVLVGKVKLDDALQSWGGQAGVQVLASGPLPPNPSELLGSEGMRSLLDDLEARADIVLFDAPPVLPVTDAAVLGAASSGLLLVVRSHHTRREQVERAAQILSTAGISPVGTVLNMVPTRGPDAAAYGYGYGYGHGESTGPYVPKGRLSDADAAAATGVRLSTNPASTATLATADSLPQAYEATATSERPLQTELAATHGDAHLVGEGRKDEGHEGTSWH